MRSLGARDRRLEWIGHLHPPAFLLRSFIGILVDLLKLHRHHLHLFLNSRKILKVSLSKRLVVPLYDGVDGVVCLDIWS